MTNAFQNKMQPEIIILCPYLNIHPREVVSRQNVEFYHF